MVKLLSGERVDKLAAAVYRVLKIQEKFTHIIEVNNPHITPCIYAMWHAHQFCIHGIPDRKNLNVLVSRSRDGQIISNVVEKWGFKTIRGSKGKKGAVEASMQMITALKSGENCAMMVDGPHGPARVVKEGVIKIAQLSEVPIVPVYWYSENFNFATLPSWDNLKLPLLDVNLINFYGEPISVSRSDSVESQRLNLQRSLESLEKTAHKAYNEVYKFGIWKKKESDSLRFKWNQR